MKVAEYLDPSLTTEMINEGYIRIQRHPTERLWIFNYTARAQYENVWNKSTSRCRGLITDDDFIVARPFEKFFNWGQVERDMLPHSQIRVQDKMDGSLGILYQEPSTGRLAIASRGSFTSEQALHATDLLRTRYEDFRPFLGVTYLFEIIYPENRIVVDYGSQDDLVLLDIIGNTDGESRVDLSPYRASWPGPVTERFHFDSIEDVLSTEPRPGKEGFVVTYRNGFRVKIKQEEYVRLHRILTGVSNKSIWEILSTSGDLTEILDRVPDEYYRWVKQTADELRAAYDFIAADTWKQFLGVMSGRPTYWEHTPIDARAQRKWFAEKIKHCEHKGILFGYYDSKSVDEALWKIVKPTYSKPYWNRTEEAA